MASCWARSNFRHSFHISLLTFDILLKCQRAAQKNQMKMQFCLVGPMRSSQFRPKNSENVHFSPHRTTAKQHQNPRMKRPKNAHHFLTCRIKFSEILIGNPGPIAEAFKLHFPTWVTFFVVQHKASVPCCGTWHGVHMCMTSIAQSKGRCTAR